MNPRNKIFTQTNENLQSIAILLLRFTIGFILFVAGAEKVIGWFSGKGLEATVDAFVSKMGIPPFLAYLSCYTEFLGGILLFLGLITRPVAVAVFINMLVATLHLSHHGFFAGRAAYPFSLMMIALTVLLTGPMRYSLDYLIFNKKKKRSH